MGTNESRLDRLEKRARDIVTAKAAREAKRVVGIWNARQGANRDLWFYPTIGAACRGMPVATLLLPGLSANW
jgi:hypothetical protein